MTGDAVYIDENGNRIDPSQLGNYEVAGSSPPQSQPQTQKPFPNAYAAMAQEDRMKNFISQTSPSATFERISYVLKGYIYDESAKEWVKVAVGVPDKIRLNFLQFITSDLSEDVRMNRLERKQINGVMESSIEWILDYLDDYADENEEENLTEDDLSKIAWILIKVIFYSVARAEGGIERHKVYGSLSLTGAADAGPSPQNFNSNKKWYQFWK